MAFKYAIPVLSLLSFSGFFVSSSHSASLTLSPVNVEVNAPASSGILTVHNPGDKPVAIQMRLFRWTQDEQGYENFLSAAGFAAVSPPIVKVPAKGRYTIRVVRINPEPLIQEEAYRLYVEEMPTSIKEGPNQVAIHLRYNVPVVFRPVGEHLHKLNLSLKKEGTKTYLILKNDGKRLIKFSKIKIQQGARATDIPSSGTPAVLAHSHRRFDISRIIGRFQKGYDLSIVVENQDKPITLTAPF